MGKYKKLEARYWGLDLTVEQQRIALVGARDQLKELERDRAQLNRIRLLAKEIPEPILGETCLYCRHNSVSGLHAPGCPWRELLKAIGVLNEGTI